MKRVRDGEDTVGERAVRLRELRRTGERFLASLELPTPFSLPALIEQLAASRGRPLYVRPLPGEPIPGGPYGLWLATTDEDFVFYERHTSRLHREHIVMHEVGHLLAHQLSRTDCAENTQWRPEPDRIAKLVPHLSAESVSRILSRDHCASMEERQAEMIASLLMGRAGLQRPHSGLSGVLGELETDLGPAGAPRV